MKRLIYTGLLALIPLATFGASFNLATLTPKTSYTPVSTTPDLAPYFKNKSGCFILFDLTENKLITEYNPTRCAERIAPDSTFKIPLSLMAFDQNIISEDSVFIWDKKDRGLDIWNQDQTPQSWLSNSAVWVSQILTPKLGMQKIKSYLQKFDYGNQDFSGNPGKHDGLTQAWLSSSLKISADEELEFLKKLDLKELPVSKTAMNDTLQNMYLETTPHGWKLYGKTGTGGPVSAPILRQSKAEGWFVGYVIKPHHTYVFVLNFSDTNRPNTTEAGGLRAKEIAKKILAKRNLL